MYKSDTGLVRGHLGGSSGKRCGGGCKRCGHARIALDRGRAHRMAARRTHRKCPVPSAVQECVQAAAATSTGQRRRRRGGGGGSGEPFDGSCRERGGRATLCRSWPRQRWSRESHLCSSRSPTLRELLAANAWHREVTAWQLLLNLLLPPLLLLPLVYHCDLCCTAEHCGRQANRCE